MPASPATPVLDADVLHEIFLLNTYRRIDDIAEAAFQFNPNRSPLTIIRHSSQVCRLWRYTLLRSPSTWARCIDLDVLDQKSDDWRDLVLQRTGDSILNVIAIKMNAIRMWRSHGLSTFLVDLLEKQWSRIGEINMSMGPMDWSDVPFRELFERPAENLRVFVLCFGSVGYHPIQLFGGYAPSLVHLSILQSPPIFLRLHSLFRTSNNLRHLELDPSSKLSVAGILSVFQHIPLLEVLKLKVSELMLNDAPNQDSLPRLGMPQLKLVCITCPKLDIYPLFLDRITPSPDCALRVVHDDVLGNSTDFSIHHMGLSLSRYASSFFINHQDQPAFYDVDLHISPDEFSFYCYHRHFRIIVRLFQRFDESIRELPYSILAKLLDTLSTFKFPRATNQLHLNVDFIYDITDFDDPGNYKHSRGLQEQYNLQISTDVRRVLESMPWVTVLTIRLTQLNTLSELSALGIFFPLLETLNLEDEPGYHCAEIGELALPFLSRSEKQELVKVILYFVFQSPEQFRVLGRNVDRDLDTRAGMKIIWKDRVHIHSIP